MNDYTINQVAMMTGFTTRTLRNYIKMGILVGDKEDGIWKFSSEDFENFISNPNVAPSLKSKRNAQVFDFLTNDTKKENHICTIMDLYIEEEEYKEVAEFFCKVMNSGKVPCTQYSMQRKGNNTRIILSGPEDVITSIMDQYNKEMK